MEIGIKRPDRVVPEYSLTGDLLSYRRCEMQYRYYNGSALPPSRPVQMWYGEFIHGMLEGAFRLWNENRQLPFPWPCTPLPQDGPPQPPPSGLAAHDLRVIGWPIEQTLAHEGKRARSRRARLAAYRRATAAINMLGPHLFPLISDAEQKVIGTRLLPAGLGALRSERYALHGIIDVLTNVEMAAAQTENVIKRAVREACPALDGTYEVIVDYKGSRRPTEDSPHWELGKWQVQTYAWLRQRQQRSLPVAAGVLIYVNELSPGRRDMEELRAEVHSGRTSVSPASGSPDYYALEAWTPGATGTLSDEFRYKRAIRVIPITSDSITEATAAFDHIVGEIETRVMNEAANGSIGATWLPTCSDEETCVACDFRYFCPRPAVRPDQNRTSASDDDDDT